MSWDWSSWIWADGPMPHRVLPFAAIEPEDASLRIAPTSMTSSENAWSCLGARLRDWPISPL